MSNKVFGLFGQPRSSSHNDCGLFGTPQKETKNETFNYLYKGRNYGGNGLFKRPKKNETFTYSYGGNNYQSVFNTDNNGFPLKKKDLSSFKPNFNNKYNNSSFELQIDNSNQGMNQTISYPNPFSNKNNVELNNGFPKENNGFPKKDEIPWNNGFPQTNNGFPKKNNEWNNGFPQTNNQWNNGFPHINDRFGFADKDDDVFKNVNNGFIRNNNGFRFGSNPFQNNNGFGNNGFGNNGFGNNTFGNNGFGNNTFNEFEQRSSEDIKMSIENFI